MKKVVCHHCYVCDRYVEGPLEKCSVCKKRTYQMVIGTELQTLYESRNLTLEDLIKATNFLYQDRKALERQLEG